MNSLTQTKQQLLQIAQQLQQWIDQGYTPTIQKQQALTQLENIYNTLYSQDAQLQQPNTNAQINSTANQDVESELTTETLSLETNETASVVAMSVNITETKVAQEDVSSTHQVDKVSEIHHAAYKPLPKQPDGVMLLGSVITEQFQSQLIDELFWRDQTFFDNEIRKFKSMPSIENALIYIGEKYNWVPNNRFAERFIELLDKYYTDNNY